MPGSSWKLHLATREASRSIIRRDLRVGVSYQTQRVSFVFSEGKLVVAGVKKHRDKLTMLTAEELDAGEALVNKLEQVRFGRTEALSDQLARKFERTQAYERGLELAKQVLDAVDLEFTAEKDPELRDLFFGLDERMSTSRKSQKQPA